MLGSLAERHSMWNYGEVEEGGLAMRKKSRSMLVMADFFNCFHPKGATWIVKGPNKKGGAWGSGMTLVGGVGEGPHERGGAV